MRAIDEIVLGLVPEKRVFIIGSAFVDMVINVPALPRPGEDIEGDYRRTTVGGCSFNVADVLHKLGLPFEAFMPVGVGHFAELVRAAFRERGYPIHDVYDAGDNGWCLSLAEASGERSFVSMSGVERRMRPEWFARFDFSSYDIFYVSGYQAEGETGEVLLEALARRRPDSVVVFDPGPRAVSMPADRIDAFFRLGALFKVNAAEALALTGSVDVESAALELSARSGSPAVVTDGARGAVLAEGGHARRISGFPVQVVDTIGSGDAQAGGLIAGLMCSFSLEESVLLGNAVASFVTGREGAATAPSRGELLTDK